MSLKVEELLVERRRVAQNAAGGEMKDSLAMLLKTHREKMS
jgi:hypothetical protein